MHTLVIAALVFFAVAALVAAVAAAFNRSGGCSAEERLDALTRSSRSPSLAGVIPSGPGLGFALEEAGWRSAVEDTLARWTNLRLMLEQADARVSPVQLLGSMAALAAAGAAAGSWAPWPLLVAPLAAAGCGCLPLLWLLARRQMRLGKIEAQLSDAMELLARSLRSGHSLADGILLIAEEMGEPIGKDFRRCYDCQNLGMSLEDSLEELTERVPLLDVRFFVNAVVLQRQTGGDTAEILDKIGRLVRERFQLRNQVKALTGEGRLSGVVLVALPLLLAVYMFVRNPDYLLVLFRDPLGLKMVAGAAVLQIIGALVIRQIVNIRV